jgi:hypothetical protein
VSRKKETEVRKQGNRERKGFNAEGGKETQRTQRGKNKREGMNTPTSQSGDSSR